MKKFYFLLLGLVIYSVTNAQVINFPDVNFKNRLLQSSPTQFIVKNLSNVYFKLDVNNDGEIQVSEATQVSYMNVSYSSISDLTGISAFINLQVLSCNGNVLSALNLSSLENLQDVNCSNNQLISLNVSGLINIQKLVCSYNQLTTLNVEGLTSLYDLNCGQNSLTTLDVNSLINLVTLDCWSNDLITLFVKNGRQESSIGFTSNPTLQYVCADEFQVQNFLNNFISLGYINATANSYCSFVPGGIYYSIQGNSKIDLENNGCNVTDLNFSNLKINSYLGNNLVGISLSDFYGNYSITAPSGSRTLIPILENPNYFNVFPPNVSVTFPAQTSPVLQNFCITPNGVHNDLEVTILPLLPARPGFDTTYKIVYKNKGNTTLSGAVTFQFEDAKMDLVSSTPLFSSQAPGILTYNYTNLQPFETREIFITMNVNSPQEIPAVNIGDQLNFVAIINPLSGDEYLLDNTSSLKQIVVGSYDPNDKTCVEGNEVGPEMIGQYVHYVIRFENTGTFPAENIVVKDMIDLTKFDLSTLIPTSSSDSFVTRIATDGKVEFIFENIQLPFDDANNDGYIAFKIKTLPSLVVGDTFSNKANIYFDYNFPIETNTATTTIQALGNTDFDFEEYLTLYPNPAKNELNIKANNNISISSINIYNVLGQLVFVSTNPTEKIDVCNLKTGSYFVKVISDKGTSNCQFIKE